MKIPKYEIIIVGVIDGIKTAPWLDHDVFLIPRILPAKGFEFFWHYGVIQAHGQYIAIVGDDVEFYPDWFEKVKDTEADVFGCSMMYPDGELFCTIGDAFQLDIHCKEITTTTYFSMNTAHRRVFDAVPMEPFIFAHDRKWGYDVGLKGFTKMFYPDAKCIHHGCGSEHGGHGSVACAIQNPETWNYQFTQQPLTIIIDKCAKCGHTEKLLYFYNPNTKSIEIKQSNPKL